MNSYLTELRNDELVTSIRRFLSIRGLRALGGDEELHNVGVRKAQEIALDLLLKNISPDQALSRWQALLAKLELGLAFASEAGDA